MRRFSVLIFALIMAGMVPANASDDAITAIYNQIRSGIGQRIANDAATDPNIKTRLKVLIDGESVNDVIAAMAAPVDQLEVRKNTGEGGAFIVEDVLIAIGDISKMKDLGEWNCAAVENAENTFECSVGEKESLHKYTVVLSLDENREIVGNETLIENPTSRCENQIRQSQEVLEKYNSTLVKTVYDTCPGGIFLDDAAVKARFTELLVRNGRAAIVEVGGNCHDESGIRTVLQSTQTMENNKASVEYLVSLAGNHDICGAGVSECSIANGSFQPALSGDERNQCLIRLCKEADKIKDNAEQTERFGDLVEVIRANRYNCGFLENSIEYFGTPVIAGNELDAIKTAIIGNMEWDAESVEIKCSPNGFNSLGESTCWAAFKDLSDVFSGCKVIKKEIGTRVFAVVENNCNQVSWTKKYGIVPVTSHDERWNITNATDFMNTTICSYNGGSKFAPGLNEADLTKCTEDLCKLGASAVSTMGAGLMQYCPNLMATQNCESLKAIHSRFLKEYDDAVATAMTFCPLEIENTMTNKIANKIKDAYPSAPLYLDLFGGTNQCTTENVESFKIKVRQNFDKLDFITRLEYDLCDPCDKLIGEMQNITEIETLITQVNRAQGACTSEKANDYLNAAKDFCTSFNDRAVTSSRRYGCEHNAADNLSALRVMRKDLQANLSQGQGMSANDNALAVIKFNFCSNSYNIIKDGDCPETFYLADTKKEYQLDAGQWTVYTNTANGENLVVAVDDCDYLHSGFKDAWNGCYGSD